MEQENHKTFSVHVKICKSTPGRMESTQNYEDLLEKIRTGITEAVGVCAGTINSYQVGEISETEPVKNNEEENNG